MWSFNGILDSDVNLSTFIYRSVSYGFPVRVECFLQMFIQCQVMYCSKKRFYVIKASTSLEAVQTICLDWFERILTLYHHFGSRDKD